ncbi:DUF7504 family protein [Halogranum rubrum]
MAVRLLDWEPTASARGGRSRRSSSPNSTRVAEKAVLFVANDYRRRRNESQRLYLSVTIARALRSLADSTRKVAIGFDILSEVIRKFELKVVFRFLSILTRQIAKTDAVAHFHLNPQRHSPVELSLVHSQFDLTITTADDLLLSDG